MNSAYGSALTKTEKNHPPDSGFGEVRKFAVFIVGLPGSGKQRFVSATFESEDGFRPFHTVTSLAPQGAETALQYERIMVMDPFLCTRAAQEHYANHFSNYQQTWVYFEPNFQACWDNLRAEANETGVRDFFKILSESYHIPTGVRLHSVVRFESHGLTLPIFPYAEWETVRTLLRA